MKNKHYQIYCDGSCKSNGTAKARAAYAYVILEEVAPNQFELVYEDRGIIVNGTNNVAELNAFLLSLKTWEKRYGGTADIFCDSAYIVNAYEQKWVDNWIRNGWKTARRTPVRNQELWEEIYPYFCQPENITINKVKGHKDNKWNNYVDRLAQTAWEDLGDE